MSNEFVIKLRVDGAKDSAAAIKAVESALQAQGIQVQGVGTKSEAATAAVKGLGVATAGAAQAADGSGNSFRTMAKQMDGMGISAKQTAAAMRNVPAQFTDIVTQLQGGANPVTVLIQQGGQLKDMFGGIGPAARALGGYVAGLINPFTATAAAVGVLGIAYYQGSKEADEFRKALLMTGNAAGTTVGQLNIMAQSMGTQFGVTVGKAAEALTVMAATGEVSRDSLSKFARTGIELEKAFDQPLSKTAQNFAELGKEPVKASLKLTDSLHYLTASTLEQIMEAERLGDKEKAAALAQDAYKEAMDQRTKTMVQNLGWVEEAWVTLGNAAKKSWDFILGVGRVDTEEEKLNRQISNLEGLIADLGKGSLTKDAQAELATLKAKKQALDDVATAQGRARAAEDDAVKARQSIVDTSKGYLSSQDKITESLQQYGIQLAALAKANPNDVLLDPAKINQTVSAIMGLPQKVAEAAKFAADVTSKSLADQTSQVQHMVDMRVLTEQTGIEQIGQLRIKDLQAQKSAQDAAASAYAADAEKSLQYRRQSLLLSIDIANEEKKTARELEALQYRQYRAAIDENTQSTESVFARADALEKELKTQQESNMAIGLGGVALAEHKRSLDLDRAASLERRASIIEEMGGQDAMSESLRREAQALRDLADARVVGAKMSEWNKVAEQLRDTITGGLMRGFENGLSIWENFKRTLRNTTLTVLIEPVIKSIVGGVLGLGSTSAMASSIFSGASGAGSMFGNLASMFDKLGANVSGSMIKAGDYLATSSNDYAAKLGELVQSSASLAGSFAKYGAAAAAGVGIGNMVSGQYSIGGNKNTATMLGTGIGALLGGPWGAVLGGALGGVANRAFGMGAREVSGSGLVGTLSTGSSSLRNYTNWHQDGGWFRSDRSGTDYSAASGDLMAGLQSQIDGAHKAIDMWSDVLGGSFKELTSSININLAGLDEAARTAKVTEAITNFTNQMVSGSISLVSEFQQTGESLTDTLAHVGQSVKTAADTFALMGVDVWANTQQALVRNKSLFTEQDGSMSDWYRASTARVNMQVVDKFGGVDSFAQSTRNFFSSFYREGEQTSRKTDLLTKKIADLGFAMPATREEFRKLAEAQDLSSSAGQTTYTALLQLAPAFADVVPWIDDASSAVRGLAKSAADIAKAFADATTSLGDEKFNLEQQLLQANGNSMQALLNARTKYLSDTTVGMSDAQASQIAAAYDYNRSLEAQITALQTVVQAEQEKYGLDTQLLQLQGNTVALRERELAALDPSNRVLQQQIYAEQDKQAADAALTKIQQEQASAAQQLADAWKSLGATMQSEVDRIRGLVSSGSTAGLAAMQADFAVNTAAARAGDQTAAAKLAGLSQSMLESALGSVSTREELTRLQAATAASLEETMRMLGGRGVATPTVPGFATGGDFAGGLRIVGEHGPELEATGASRIFNASQTASMLGGGSGMVDELRALRAEVASLRAEVQGARADNTAENRALVEKTSKVASILDDVSQGGTRIRTVESAA